MPIGMAINLLGKDRLHFVKTDSHQLWSKT
jgi:hypothetical protein